MQPRFDGAVSHLTGCSELNGTPVHDGDDMRYRLDVIAASVLDVVEAAGGWLFDRRMAGWDVTVLVPEEEDVHALRILGVDIVQVGPTWTSWLERPQVQALAVAADLFDRDPRVKHAVLQVLEQGLPEIILWGNAWPAGLARSADEVRHELSGAARMFKCHAVKAASGREPASVDQVEVFHCGTSALPSPLTALTHAVGGCFARVKRSDGQLIWSPSATEKAVWAMPRLSGKVAVVTGATRGIGKGIALALGAEGATVYVTGRTVDAGLLRASRHGRRDR